MPQIITTTVYQYDELDEAGQEKARAWYREGAFDDEWWDNVYDDVEQVAKILGIEIDRRNQKCRMTDGSREWIDRSPAIYFSGFWNQGDGACFEGWYRYQPGSVAEIAKYAPQDICLHGIAENLQRLQRPYFYSLTASIKHTGHYYHEHSMTIDVESKQIEVSRQDEDELAANLRSFARWIYRQLEDEYEYENSDEVVAENIRINEYTFTANGKREG